MFSSEISWWAVVLAAVVYMIVGYLWYSPYLFGKKWLELARIREEDKGHMGLTILITFLAALLISYVLTDLSAYVHIEGFGDGALLGFWIWLGFVATSELMSVLYAKKPLAMYFIDVGSYLVAFVLMGGVIGLFV